MTHYIAYELSDGREYIFNPYRVTTLESIEDVYDEDWQTAVARGNSYIPKGTKVVLEDVITNFYGKYLCVRYNGYLFYAKPSAFKYVESEED